MPPPHIIRGRSRSEQSSLIPLATNHVIRLTTDGKTYALVRLHAFSARPHHLIGEYKDHADFGFAFEAADLAGIEEGHIGGRFMSAVEVHFKPLSRLAENRIMRRLSDKSLTNEIEFREPIITLCSDPVEMYETDAQALTAPFPFNDPTFGHAAPLVQSEALVAVEDWAKLGQETSMHDRRLSPAILEAIDAYFASLLQSSDAIVLDPMLGSGEYLRVVRSRYPCKITVGDLSPEILQAFSLDGVEKRQVDAAEIFEQLGEHKKQVKLVVLRGCNFEVVTHGKAKQIFAHIYNNLSNGSGIIITGATPVLFDSAFIQGFPGAEILQMVAWNTSKVIIPFYVVRKT